MLHKPIRTIQDFLLSTYFADGLRITMGVLFPSLIMARFGQLSYGMTLSLGALCVSIVDTPGPIVHRRNAMLVTAVLTFLVSIIVGLTNTNIYLTAIILTLCSFLFSMFFLYGNRAAAVGTAVLLIMVLSIDDFRNWRDVIFYAMLIFAGSIWYTLLSYSVYRLRPYRILQQILSDSILEVSQFLRAKSKFYNPKIDYDKTYTDLLELQIKVSHKQDEVRDVLFRMREIVRESTPEGRFLLLVFLDMVDLFEQIMSTHYNYKKLREQFHNIDILNRYEKILIKIAISLEEIAFALKRGGNPVLANNLTHDIYALKKEITALETNQEPHQYNTLGIIMLKNIEINIENIVSRITTINSYFNKKEKKNLKKSDIDISKFVNKQNFGAKLFYENLSFSSSTFRHSLRVSVAMLIGFIVAKLLNFEHSYWILLTILVISKPGFSLTKERNIQRIIGTVAGAFIGMSILKFVYDKNILFVILLICMIGCYSFQRKNYVVSVLFMTPYILVLFNFLGMGGISIARERIYDTLIGSAIAFLASYSLFPYWEYEKLKEAMVDMIKSNRNYFEQVSILYFNPHKHHLTIYKVARKEVYVNSSNLSSLFQRMFSEPKSKQLNMKELHQFTVLNHLITSYIASLSVNQKEHKFSHQNIEELKTVADNTLYLLDSVYQILLNRAQPLVNIPLIRRNPDQDEFKTQAEISLAEQFDLLQKVAYDIYKLADKIDFSQQKK